MVEILSLFRPSFNKSLRIESRPERVTAEPGAVLLREIMERTQITEWLAGRVCDPRQGDRVIYPLADLLRYGVGLFAAARFKLCSSRSSIAVSHSATASSVRRSRLA